MLQLRHPCSAIAADRLRRAFLPLLTLTLAVMLVMNWIGDELQSEAAPAGIVTYEFAGDSSTAARILDSWGEQARLWASFSLGLDYLFLVLYSTTIALGCLWAAGRIGGSAPWLAAVGVPLAWGQWVAALCDATENAALTRMLLMAPSDGLAQLARWTASAKFALILAGLVYSALGALVWLIAGRRRTS
ncbi:MAG TPA: hypothetical protein VJ123_07735 [Anaerolineales bacterium]|nr:hypothetical protein [Anaerolineales bacterium]